MKKVGSGQITITDLMDGELTLELTSNLSRVQTYSSSAGLNPDWTVTNLRLTPIVRFNGQIIKNNDKNLSFSYLKKINSQAISKLDSSSELIDEATKELVVNQNNLNKENSENILYICAVTYQLNNNVFSAQNSLMFSLLKNGQNGGDAYTLLLTNENHSFAGDETVALEGEVTTSVIGYKGSTEQNVKIKKVNGIAASTSPVGVGITGLQFKVSSLNSVKQPSITFYATNALAVSSGTIPITIEIDGKDFIKNFSFTVSHRGATGEAASLLTLTASQQYFKSTDGGKTYGPDSIVLTPSTQNCTCAYWYYSTNNGSNWNRITTTTVSDTQCYFDATTKQLTIPKGFSEFNSEVTAISFRCQSDIENVYDVITIARITDVVDMDLGVTNYILNSNFYNGADNWAIGGISTLAERNSRKWIRCRVNESTRIGEAFATARSNIWSQNPHKFILSFDAQSVQVESESTEVEWAFTFMFRTDTNSETGPWTVYATIDSEKKRYSLEINAEIARIFTGFRLSASPKTNKTCDVYFTNFQLVIGDKDTDWKPAPEDSFDVVVNLDTKYNSRFEQTDRSIAAETERINTVTTALTDADGNIISVDRQITSIKGRIETTEGKVAMSVTREDLATGKKDGSALTLKPDMVRIGWNGISSYWAFEGNHLILYYSTNQKIFDFNDYTLDFYDGTTNNYELARFDRSDWVFYKGISTSTGSYKICSIGRSYFQVFAGDSGNTQLALFDDNGIQLNDTNGNKRVTITSNGLKAWYGGYVLAEYGSNGAILNDGTGSKRVQVNNSGLSFYNGGNEIGTLYKRTYSGTNYYGISLGIPYQNVNYLRYITMSSQESSSGDYMMKWTYVRSSFGNMNTNTLNAGCDIDMHWFTIKNVNFENAVNIDTFTVVVSIDSFNNEGINYTTKKLKFLHGICVSTG